MKTFKDLVFKPHPTTIPEDIKQELIKKGIDKDADILQPMLHAFIELNNYTFSVLKGKMFYSNGEDTYEAWCKELDDDPRGYLTEEEVTEYMKEIQEVKHDTK